MCTLKTESFSHPGQTCKSFTPKLINTFHLLALKLSYNFVFPVYTALLPPTVHLSCPFLFFYFFSFF